MGSIPISSVRKKISIMKKMIFIIIILLTMCLVASRIREGFTQCSQIQNCATCTNAIMSGSDVNNNKCFWSSAKQQCSSFLDSGYSSTCGTSSSSVAASSSSSSSVASSSSSVAASSSRVASAHKYCSVKCE